MENLTCLSRLERVCLRYLRERGEAPDLEASSIEDGVVILRNSRGEVLAEICDGFQLITVGAQPAGLAIVRPFVIRVRCFNCARSTVRDAAEWLGGEVWECRCGAQCVLPKDPVATAKEYRKEGSPRGKTARRSRSSKRKSIEPSNRSETPIPLLTYSPRRSTQPSDSR